MEEKRCFKCRWFATRGWGYSNYTVMLCVAHCVLNKNTHFPSEESYSWRELWRDTRDEIQTLVAESCNAYEEVDEKLQIDLDPDGETTLEAYKGDTALYLAATMYDKWDWVPEGSGW